MMFHASGTWKERVLKHLYRVKPRVEKKPIEHKVHFVEVVRDQPVGPDFVKLTDSDADLLSDSHVVACRYLKKSVAQTDEVEAALTEVQGGYSLKVQYLLEPETRDYVYSFNKDSLDQVIYATGSLVVVGLYERQVQHYWYLYKDRWNHGVTRNLHYRYNSFFVYDGQLWEIFKEKKDSFITITTYNSNHAEILVPSTEDPVIVIQKERYLLIGRYVVDMLTKKVHTWFDFEMEETDLEDGITFVGLENGVLKAYVNSEGSDGDTGIQEGDLEFPYDLSLLD